MKQTGAALLLSLALALPAAAQQSEDGLSEGFDLLQEGTRLMLRGLMEQLEPALRDMRDRIGDLSAYHPPEILPNGDILLRRKVPLEPEEEPVLPPPTGEDIEL
jgi:hypothetical protein